MGNDDKLFSYVIQNQIAGKSLPLRYIDSILQREKYFSNNSSILCNKEDSIFICKDISHISNKEDMWDTLISGQYTRSKYLIFYVDKLDLRSKLAKKFKQFIVNLSEIKVSNINSVVSTRLSDKASNALFEKCGGNFTKFNLEYMKVKALSDVNSITEDDALRILWKEHTISNSIEEDSFSFTDMFLSKCFPDVIKYLHENEKVDFDFGIETLLYNNFRNLLIYKIALANNSLSNCGINKFILSKISKYNCNFTIEQLLSALKIISTLDRDVKIGNIDSQVGWKLMITKLLGVIS